MDEEQSQQITDQPHTQMIFRYFLVIFLITIFFLGKLLWPFMSILVLAFVLTGTFYPIYDFFARRMRPALASAITCVVIFLVVFVPAVFIVGALSKEAYDLYLMGKSQTVNLDLKELFQNSHIIQRIQGILARFNIQLSSGHLNTALAELGRNVGLFLYDQLSAFGSNVLKFLVNFAFMLLVIFFILIDGRKLIAYLVDLSPLPDDQDRKLMLKFHEMASVVLVVNGISGLIQGFLGGVAFWIFGLSSPLLWGCIMAILAFFPIVGISVVLVPTSVYLLLKGRIAAGIFFLVFYIVVSSVIEYVVKPKLVGDRVQMHTLLVFIAVLGGLKVFGILGIIYGPLVVTAFLTLTDIYRSSYEAYIRDGQPCNPGRGSQGTTTELKR
jgi:predicted PurR-regulated permease PerM